MEHVVTMPPAPFRAAGGRLEVEAVPSGRDNLVWRLTCVATGATALVDGPVATEGLAAVDRAGGALVAVLNTHVHGDHVGLNHHLDHLGRLDGLHVAGPAARAAEVPGLTQPVDEGSEVRLGALRFRVLRTDGHQTGHVCYVCDDVLLCGDTLFAGGCGYLFDGPPAAMHASLTRLAALDPATRVCCAHEYTEDNLRFAWAVEPGNAALAARVRAVWALRARGGCTVPSTIGEERATNPFLRPDSAELRATLQARGLLGEGASDLEVFTAARALKNTGFKASDADLPLGA